MQVQEKQYEEATAVRQWVQEQLVDSERAFRTWREASSAKQEELERRGLQMHADLAQLKTTTQETALRFERQARRRLLIRCRVLLSLLH